MRPQFWNSIGNIYWRRVWLCAVAGAAGAGALAAIVPPKVLIYVTSILTAVGIATGIMIRGVKFVQDRNLELPPGGQNP